jgi:hypothetical protein
MRSDEKPIEIGSSMEKDAGKIDRRVSVTPMMDWTDEANPADVTRYSGGFHGTARRTNEGHA